MPAVTDLISPSESSHVGAGIRVREGFYEMPHFRVDKYHGDVEVVEKRDPTGKIVLSRKVVRKGHRNSKALVPYASVEGQGNLLTAQGAQDLWNAINGGSITGGYYNNSNSALCVADGNPTAVGSGASATFTNGSTSVTISSTSGPNVGDKIRLDKDGGWYTISVITSNVSFTLSSAYTGVTGSGTASYITQEAVANTDLNFTQSASLGGGISGVSNASTSTITTASAHGLVAGQVVTIASVGGATGANGTWVVNTVPTTATFTIVIGSGPGVYTSGGTVKLNNECRQLVSSTALSVAVGGAITNVSNVANPTITTTTAHGLVVGQMVSIASVVGATGVNGTWTVLTVPTTTTFTITLASGPGAYSSGGTTTLINILQAVATFGTTQANFTWNEWGLSNCGAAQSGVHLLNRKVIYLGGKSNQSSFVLTATLSLS